MKIKITYEDRRGAELDCAVNDVIESFRCVRCECDLPLVGYGEHTRMVDIDNAYAQAFCDAINERGAVTIPQGYMGRL